MLAIFQGEQGHDRLPLAHEVGAGRKHVGAVIDRHVCQPVYKLPDNVHGPHRTLSISDHLHSLKRSIGPVVLASQHLSSYQLAAMCFARQLAREDTTLRRDWIRHASGPRLSAARARRYLLSSSPSRMHSEMIPTMVSGVAVSTAR